MEARLPEEKLQRIQLLVAEWLDKKKSYNTENPVPSWPATTSNQGSQAWNNLCSPAIFYCSQSTGDGFLHKTEHGLSLSYMLIACIPTALEWNKLAAIDHTSHTE